MIDNQIKTIQNQYGKLIAKTKAESDDEITGTFFSEIEEIDHKATIDLSLIKEKNRKMRSLVLALATESP